MPDMTSISMPGTWRDTGHKAALCPVSVSKSAAASSNEANDAIAHYVHFILVVVTLQLKLPSAAYSSDINKATPARTHLLAFSPSAIFMVASKTNVAPRSEVMNAGHS
eukprot:COSAG02_NODE_2376_length_9010_cov_16.725732_2_plen_108_part_00